MPGIVDLLRLFRLTALRANGTGVAGATIRILNSASTDVTASFFQQISPVTDTEGVVVRPFVVATGLPAGIYTIQVIATGFAPWSYTTSSDFIGEADLTANLTLPASLGNYLISEPTTKPASSMIPVVTTVSSPNAFGWEYIQCKVESSTGKSSILEAPIDKATHQAIIDFHNRLQLGIRPLLVSTAALTARPDTDFSDQVTVSFRSLSSEASTPITYTRPGLGSGDDIQTSFHLLTAATLPPDGETDLSDYTKATNRKWIVPALPVVVFRGFYRDVSIWLPVAPVAANYTLTVTYYNAAATQLSTITASLSASPYVQRIRLNADPAAGVTRSVLTLTDGSTSVTEPLTVLYRD